MITWIRNINLPQYHELLGPNARVFETSGNYSKVQFDTTSMQIWVESGYWHGWPNIIIKLIHKFI